ncbi:tRNA glutamyl-Q(34) synthetase GluQRS [Erythrobacter sp. KY5]|uniref:tRNA glutamyl-Q(34) synthetase GluQRS n=1 Tax=Erythrobacter sp. KY5 TaxID=2011159 RepID=UPI000DBF1668|nr:tRNA glutamyl-Q(34) synthetase GluQRS [Erythrobacter sp. KY5]AWW73020.1 tRNA glutamyl-Q(34) synthetase GluQRS [Erythrobacter sp. KY5]
MSELPLVTRFAPSPNGHLHLGHAFSAIIAHDIAKAAKGRFLLRIEDIDGPRSRPELADEYRRDLEWLGLEWDEVPAQSTRLDSYAEAARDLVERGFLYPCTCTRKEIAALPKRVGSDGVEYPGSCRDTCEGKAGEGAALRIDVVRALAEVGEVVWVDETIGSVVADPRALGDVVIVRKDLPASYNLAVTLDDAADGVSLVTRGEDLLETTHIHRILQELLKLPVPTWHHHELVLAEDGTKLAKRRGSPPIAERRKAGEDGLVLAEQVRLRNFELGS